MKKLKLNKETISFLTRNQMLNVKGGGGTTGGTGTDTDTGSIAATMECRESDVCPTKDTANLTCGLYGCSEVATGCDPQPTETCDSRFCPEPTTGTAANPSL